MSIASTSRNRAPETHTGQAHHRRHLRPVPGEPAAAGPVPAVVSADLGVPTLHRTVVDYANLDHAASTPALVSVKQAVDTALRTYSSVHRGNGYASRVTSRWYEAAREEVRRFVGAREGDEVVFTRNTTDSFNLLARALPRGTEVFVFEAEHHATLLPWAGRTTRLPVPGSLDDARVLLSSALERSTARHRLVVLCGASNVTGEVWPVRELADVAHQHFARVALDAAQLAPHRPIDLEALGVDYVAFSGHKLYAPFGAGVLAGPGDWLDQAAPYLAGGGATASVTERGTTWHRGAARHEAGSPNVIGAVALAAACSTLAEHREAVEAHESALGRWLADGLAAIDGVQTYSIFGPDHARVPVVAFTVDGLDSSLVSAALSAEHGIGVRDGKFCAHLLVDALLDDPYAAGPASAVRASVGLANTAEHVDRLLSAVASLAARGPAFEYERGPEGWTPVSDPRDLSLPRPW
ncbi:aminotransferase class V-fold PLP-dependent enzyme [Knoellia sp. 3-2P3]|uniref:aminotransferase class V-fold PLP-dependent enzyme n=1 Tax=unclassified Knoellia TaxID=2618719 RepID=UPI0023DB644E|nr:aminotransferase class V-fold PLP-dependent enzyme [Knoellia sp. 3-2P3]MDF2092811.1 aminotransferase class V-fold PLP-dependent enzyme [Knoellia sp. 3-2P3]